MFTIQEDNRVSNNSRPIIIVLAVVAIFACGAVTHLRSQVNEQTGKVDALAAEANELAAELTAAQAKLTSLQQERNQPLTAAQ